MKIGTFIKHRINTKYELANTPLAWGAELDLRSEGDRIILHHDAFKEGEDFTAYLEEYHHQCLILNTKTDGLEDRIIQIMNERLIENYFFLDTTVPTLVRLVRQGFSKMAVRFSEVEPLSFVENFAGKAEWVWVDCFTRNMLTPETYTFLKERFKICIVSPELQAHPLSWIGDFKSAFAGFELDAVCTKNPDLWK